jgi:hypothetical protein
VAPNRVTASEDTLAARHSDEPLKSDLSTHLSDLGLEAGICFSSPKAPVLVIDEGFVALQESPA